MNNTEAQKFFNDHFVFIKYDNPRKKSTMDREYVNNLLYNVVGCPIESAIIENAAGILAEEFGEKALNRALALYAEKCRAEDDKLCHVGEETTERRRQIAREVAVLDLWWTVRK